MAIVTLKLPEVKYYQKKRPSRCPYYHGETLQRWGGNVKRVKDPRLRVGCWYIAIAVAAVGKHFGTTRKGSVEPNKRHACGRSPQSDGFLG
ncbi:MAG: hypothetical protein HPY45_12910 [Anaerolineae bacterium]|nr:hypothetical protein [Anaerolineae bacterium]